MISKEKIQETIYRYGNYVITTDEGDYYKLIFFHREGEIRQEDYEKYSNLIHKNIMFDKFLYNNIQTKIFQCRMLYKDLYTIEEVKQIIKEIVLDNTFPTSVGINVYGIVPNISNKELPFGFYIDK